MRPGTKELFTCPLASVKIFTTALDKGVSMMNDTLLALTILIGQYDVDWIPCVVDEVEWTEPRYYHQN